MLDLLQIYPIEFKTTLRLGLTVVMDLSDKHPWASFKERWCGVQVIN